MRTIVWLSPAGARGRNEKNDEQGTFLRRFDRDHEGGAFDVRPSD